MKVFMRTTFLFSLLLPSCLSLVSTAMSCTSGVAVIGCGVLGTSLCKQLIEAPEFSEASVTGVTKTTTHHASILETVGSDRFSVQTADAISGTKFKNVVFCAPPSGFEDYPGALEDAIKNVWAGPDAGGSFVFTSSGGIYAGADGETVTEMSPTDDPESSPRVAKLVHAEAVCLKSGGCCLRLAGLYTLERGAHSYWLKSGKEIQGRKDGIINLLHYDDAAGACLAALKVGATVTASRVFLVSDGNPTTRRGIVDSALKSKLFSGMADPGFLGTKGEGGAMGKIYDGSFTDQALKWKPRYPSFDHFMSTQ